MSTDRHKPSKKGEASAPTVGSTVPQSDASSQWSKRWKIAMSLAVTIHMLAVFAEPFRFFTRSSQRAFSPDAGFVRSWLSHYIDFAYLHHGYFFFAPNPGPSHLISARIGSPTPPNQPKEILIPDKTVQWPRLYYHRHFMLSEFLHNSFAPPEKPEEANFDPLIEQQWQRDRDLYVAVKESIENHFRKRENQAEVSIRRVEHLLPNDIQVYRDKWKLNDPRLYVILPESLAEQAPTSVVPPLLPNEQRPIPFPAQTVPGAEALEGTR